MARLLCNIQKDIKETKRQLVALEAKLERLNEEYDAEIMRIFENDV